MKSALRPFAPPQRGQEWRHGRRRTKSLSIPGQRLYGPKVCKTNAHRKDGRDVAPDGIHDVPSGDHRPACNTARRGMNATTYAIRTSFTPTCFQP